MSVTLSFSHENVISANEDIFSVYKNTTSYPGGSANHKKEHFGDYDRVTTYIKGTKTENETLVVSSDNIVNNGIIYNKTNDGVYFIKIISVPTLQVNTKYSKDDCFYYNGNLYKCLQNELLVTQEMIETVESTLILHGKLLQILEHEINSNYTYFFGEIVMIKSRACICDIVRRNNQLILENNADIFDEKNDLKDIYQVIAIDSYFRFINDQFTEEITGHILKSKSILNAILCNYCCI